MKRFLIIALAVMLVVAMLAVPAFASTVCTGVLDDYGFCVLSQIPNPGRYQATFDWVHGGLRISCVLPPFDLQVFVDEDLSYLGGIAPMRYMLDGECFEGQVEIAIIENAAPTSDNPEYVVDAVGVTNGTDMLTIDNFVLSTVPVSEEAAVDSVLGVFTGIGSWLVAELGNATSLFYQADTGLTILGVLAVAGLGIAVVFLLINWIKSLLQFRK